MRFVSDKRGLSITVRSGSAEVRDPATRSITAPAEPDIEAKFSHDLLDPEAIRQAWTPRSQGGLANIDRRPDGSMPDSPFRGIQEDESGKHLPAEIRFSVFDSEIAQLTQGWSDDVRDEVEQTLLAHAGGDYVLVSPVPTGKPWNGYDDVTDPDDVIKIAALTNSDFASVLTYERENQARTEIIVALAKEIALLGETDVVVNA